MDASVRRCRTGSRAVLTSNGTACRAVVAAEVGLTALELNVKGVGFGGEVERTLDDVQVVTIGWKVEALVRFMGRHRW